MAGVTERALAGWTVGVTADRRAAEQIELLERRGAQVVHGPTIRTQPLEAGGGVRDATEALAARPPDAVVLTTGVGTRAWFDAADAVGAGDALRRALDGSVVLARGPKAAGAATAAGLQVAWQAPGARSSELVAHLAGSELRSRRVAVQLDGRDAPVLGDAVRALGADVVDVPVYRWTLPDDDGPAHRLVDAVIGGRVDAVTFTSSPALDNLLELARRRGRGDEVSAALAGPVVLASIGVVCTATARSLGLEPAVQPARHRLGALVHELARAAERTDRTAAVSVGGVRVVVRAAAAVIDGEVVALADRDRDLLAALLARPGSVVSKRALAGRVWPAGTDPHTVEVAVGRLRRRLGGRLAVEAVPRRGYRLAHTRSAAV